MGRFISCYIISHAWLRFYKNGSSSIVNIVSHAFIAFKIAAIKFQYISKTVIEWKSPSPLMISQCTAVNCTATQMYLRKLPLNTVMKADSGTWKRYCPIHSPTSDYHVFLPCIKCVSEFINKLLCLIYYRFGYFTPQWARISSKGMADNGFVTKGWCHINSYHSCKYYYVCVQW